MGDAAVEKSPVQVCIDARNVTKFDFGQGDIEHKYPVGFVIPMAMILMLVSAASVVGNGLVVATIARHRGMRTRTNLLLANLAAADILVGAVDMPFSLVALIQGKWVFGESFCQFNAFTTGLALMASIHTLMFISIHKYLSMTRPFGHLTKLRIILMAASTWIWGICYNLLPFFEVTHNVYKEGATQCGPIIPCTGMEKMHSLINTVMNFIVPLVVLIFCNYKIVNAVKEHIVRMKKTSNKDNINLAMQQKHITLTLVIVMVCFILCWGPYIAYSCSLVFITRKELVPVVLNPIVYWCGYLNSACNPIIYAFRSPSFRDGYLEIICRKRTAGRIGSFYSGSASCKGKTASQRTYLSQYSKSRKQSGIVSKAVMNHLRFRSQMRHALRRCPSAPNLRPRAPPAEPRLRRYDSDTCLLATLATPGLDLWGRRASPSKDADPASSFHTLPEEEEAQTLLGPEDAGDQRRLRSASGAFVVCVSGEPQLPEVIITEAEADAISNESLQTLSSRSWADELAMAVTVERHRCSVQSLQAFGRNVDVARAKAAADPGCKRATHHDAPAPSGPKPSCGVKRCTSDPSGLAPALRRFGSVEHLGGRHHFQVEPRAPLRARGLLASKGSGIRNSIMALLNKASSSYSVTSKK